MGYQVIIAPSARFDLRSIVQFIAADSPERAATFGRYLTDSTRHLADFPEIGRRVPESDDPTYREIVVRPYRVIYRVDHADRRVEVIRFWHGARGSPDLGTA